MFALRRYHSKGQNSVTRLLHYWADVGRAWGFKARNPLFEVVHAGYMQCAAVWGGVPCTVQTANPTLHLVSATTLCGACRGLAAMHTLVIHIPGSVGI